MMKWDVVRGRGIEDTQDVTILGATLLDQATRDSVEDMDALDRVLRSSVQVMRAGIVFAVSVIQMETDTYLNALRQTWRIGLDSTE